MNIHIELFDILDFIYPPFKRNGLRITGSRSTMHYVFYSKLIKFK